MSGGSSYGSCCYADCTNSYSANSNSIFFKFPNDDARRKKWVENCGNPEIAQLSDRHLRGKRICALHFPDSSFADPAKKETLTDRAVPNKYLKGKSDEGEEEVNETPKRTRGRQPAKTPESSTSTTPAAPLKSRRASAATATQPPALQPAAEDEKKKSVTGSCCYAECTNSSGNSSVPLFTLPTDEVKRKKWIANIGNPDLAQASERSLKFKRVCAGHFADSAFTDLAKKDNLTDRAVPIKYTKAKQEPEEPEPPKKAESPQRTQSPTRAESPKRGRWGRPSAAAKISETPAKLVPEPEMKTKTNDINVDVQRRIPAPAKVQSSFGKSLYTLLNGLLYDDEPSVRKEKRPATKPAETVAASIVESRSPVRLINGRTIKTEVIEPRGEKMPRLQKLPTIRPVGQGKSNRLLEQFVNIGGGDSGNLIIQNGGEFTLAEGEEYEVIGESDGNEQIQVVESDSNEIEIIEVDDQTMAQLTAQNVFFQNSGNIQVTELDPNMGQILKVINPQDAYFHQYQ